MSEVMRAAMDILYSSPDIGGLAATYVPPGGTVGVACHVLDEPAESLTMMGTHSAGQSARIVSVRFPGATVPVQNGVLTIGTQSYRIVHPEPDDLRVTYRLDLEPA
jgi:hypothetical protein